MRRSILGHRSSSRREWSTRRRAGVAVLAALAAGVLVVNPAAAAQPAHATAPAASPRSEAVEVPPTTPGSPGAQEMVNVGGARGKRGWTGTGRPPAGYPVLPEPSATAPDRTSLRPDVSDETGNLLEITPEFLGGPSYVTAEILGSPGNYYTFCSERPIFPEVPHYTICTHLQIFDPGTADGHTTTNNSGTDAIYDACGTLVVQTHKFGYWSGDGTGLSSGDVTGPFLTPSTDSSCFGPWVDAFSFTQTFTNGRTLTVSAMESFMVYPSLDAADADRAPQPAPDGGPVDPAEQYGDSGCDQPVQCASSGDPVNTATGNFWHTFDDLSIPGRGPALDLTRTYNSLAAGTDGRFGYGWMDSYAMSLSVGASAVTVHQANAAQATFTTTDGSAWSAPPRVLGTLTHNGDGSWTFVHRARQSYTFDSSGRLTAISDPNGNRTTVGYPSASSMVATDPAGRTLTFALTGSHVTSVQDSASPSRSLSYGYDGAGNLIDVVDVGGGHWQFSYDGAHRLLTMRSPRFYGDTTTSPAPLLTNHYDGAGRIDRQTDQLGRQTTFDYSSITGATKVTDPKGNAVVHRYQDGLLVSVTAGYGTAQGTTWYYRYDPATLGRVSTFYPTGHSTTATYDAAGNRTSSTDGLGRTTGYTYNALDQVTSVTEPKRINGQPITTTLSYDTAGNLLSRSSPLLDSGGATTATAVTSYHHDDPAHPSDITSVVDPNNHTTTLTYDPVGDLSSVTDAAGDKTTFGYDTGRGWRTWQVSPKGNVSGANAADYTTTYGYDAYGRPTLVRDPLWTSTAPNRHQTVRHYDPDGNLDSVADADGHTTTVDFDAAGEQTAVHRPDSTVLRADYWPDGTIHNQYDAANRATVYAYDPLAQLSSVTDPLGRTTQYRLDADGNLVTVTDPAGRTTTRSYDAADQWIGTNYSDPATPDVTNVGYDADGQRTAMTDGTGTSTWSWDSLHRVVSTTTGASKTVGYHYDLGDRLTTVDYPDSLGTVTRGYDAADRLTSVTDWNAHQTTFGYDPDSQLVNQIYPNGTTATTSFDRTGQVSGIQHAPTANPAAPLAAFGYGRTDAGLLTSVTSTGVPADSHTYGYNPLHQLVGVDTSTYGYDSAGNLTKRQDNTRQLYDAASELAAVTTNPAISLVGTASAGDSTSSALTLALPAGTTAGDQVLVAASLASGKSASTPTGYTVVGTFASGTGNTAAKIVVFRHTVVAGDTAVTVSFQGKIAKTVALAVYRGVHPTNPVDATSSGATPAGTAVTAASHNSTAIGDQLVMITGASGTAGTWTAPAGMTTRVQKIGATTDAAIADQPLAAAGATGSRTATHTVSTQLVGALITLRPAQTSLGYDLQGNRTSVQPLSGAATALGYDQADRLTSYAGSTTYAYNGDNLRTSKTVSGVSTAQTWDISSAVAALLTDGSTAYVYGPDGLPLEQVTSGGVLYYHHDQLGSTRALTNATGTVVASYTYDPYGNLTASTGTATNPFRYASQYTDTETGYQYLRSRYYDPATAQFLTRDPLVALTQAPYSYANSTPLNDTDPLGLFGAKAGRFLADHAGAVSETLAIGAFATEVLCPECALLALGMGALSDTTGALQAIKHFSDGDYQGAAVDVVALVPGVGGLGAGLRRDVVGESAQLARVGKSLDAAAAGAGEVSMYEHPAGDRVPRC